VQLPPSNVTKLDGGSCTLTEAIVTVLCTHDGCGWHPKHVEWVHKTVNTASGTVQLPPSNVANLTTLDGGSCTVTEAVITVLCTHDGCGWHPKHVEWVHKTVTTASDTVQLPPSNVANLTTLDGDSCTVTEAVVTVLCTYDGCGWHPKHVEWVHKTVTTASSTVQLPPSNVTNLATLEGGSCTENMTSIGGCSYSFLYSWWWAWLTPETCRVNSQNNK